MTESPKRPTEDQVKKRDLEIRSNWSDYLEFKHLWEKTRPKREKERRHGRVTNVSSRISVRNAEMMFISTSISYFTQKSRMTLCVSPDVKDTVLKGRPDVMLHIRSYWQEPLD